MLGTTTKAIAASYVPSMNEAIGHHGSTRGRATAGHLDSVGASESGWMNGFVAGLDARERGIVRLAMHVSRFPAATRINSLLNSLGNGWLYLMVLIALFLTEGLKGMRPAMAGAVSVGVAFVFYAWLKPRLARSRPCDADPQIRATCKPLDRYSCPSGHSMVAAGVAIPLLLSFPYSQPLIVALGVLVAWSRVACGHHYPSDVLLGVALGTAVAIPVCTIVL